jgi:hypothetical protein
MEPCATFGKSESPSDLVVSEALADQREDFPFPWC